MDFKIIFINIEIKLHPDSSRMTYCLLSKYENCFRILNQILISSKNKIHKEVVKISNEISQFVLFKSKTSKTSINLSKSGSAASSPFSIT